MRLVAPDVLKEVLDLRGHVEVGIVRRVVRPGNETETANAVDRVLLYVCMYWRACVESNRVASSFGCLLGMYGDLFPGVSVGTTFMQQTEQTHGRYIRWNNMNTTL